ncbi:hypothetical protein DVH24_008960 [Malus domestica]|uniref:Uncharacterized protein n=1 Tax=Malus domestica TaxID=3750 RepID=A0A498JN46_MALDO|nr:hypothetical protein DVH24_008960 [Malus domestica]
MDADNVWNRFKSCVRSVLGFECSKPTCSCINLNMRDQRSDIVSKLPQDGPQHATMSPSAGTGPMPVRLCLVLEIL